MPTKLKNPQPAKSQLRCRASGEIAQWLAESGGSLAITTYTSGKLVLVSHFEGRLRFRTHRFVRPMGIALSENEIALAVRRQVKVLARSPTDHNTFALRKTYETGKVDAHDVAFGRRGVYFVNTRYNAIARVSSTKRFVHCWQPPFIKGVVSGDRCHLNGLGMRDGRPRMATAFCATGHAKGWREENRFTAGVLIDVEQNQVVADGLCMPHSPRWHEGRWWFCNSGHGLLSTFDAKSGTHTDVCALPGFTRGLCLVDDHALVGLSKIRRKHILDAPPVRRRCKNIAAGIALVHLPTGKTMGRLEFLNGGSEVYEVLFLAGVQQPRLRLDTKQAS